MRALGYVRVSTREQADSGLGLAAQRSAITADAERRGWDLDFREDKGATGSNLRRDGLQEALHALQHHKADALIVSKLDRLSRSLVDFAGIMEMARKQGWALIALDLGVDTTTPAGEMIASVMASFAQYERRLISLRTRDALAERKAQGVRLGRPAFIAPETMATILALSETHRPNAIARLLDEEGVPTPSGARQWWGNTVSRIIRAQSAA